MSHPSSPFGPFQFTGAMLGERFSLPSDPSPAGQPFAFAPGDAPRAVRSVRPLNRPHMAGASPSASSAPLPFSPPRLTWPIVAPVEVSQLPKSQVAGAWTDWLPPTSGISLYEQYFGDGASSDSTTPDAPNAAPSAGQAAAEGAASGKGKGDKASDTSWLLWLAGGTAVAVVAGVAYSRMKK